MIKYRDPSVSLEGQLYTDFFYGRPSYGESPADDEVEQPTFLALDHPIKVEGDATHSDVNYNIAESFVDRIQLATPNIHLLRQVRGCGVRLKGPLWHAHTGHHHAPVLMSVQEPPVVLDNRHTYPGKTIFASGSGFFLGQNGLICTAAHVLAEAKCITVTRGLYRQRALTVAIDNRLDLALLRIEPTGIFSDILLRREFKARPLRTWMAPRLGERVYAFGFPLGGTLPHSLNMTEGIISSEIGIENHQFQISAAIQDGNSGGPVIDRHGNIIGVAISSLEPSQNITFAFRAIKFGYSVTRTKSLSVTMR